MVNVLERGQAITEEWINENRKVYDELYQQLFDGKEAPAKLNPVDLETINIAITEKRPRCFGCSKSL